VKTAPAPLPSKYPWWLESLLWTLCIGLVIGIAAYLNETVREVVAQGLAYMFVFLSTPFVLETTTAFIGICVVIAINNRRLEREGDGWVEMEITQPEATEGNSIGQAPADKAAEV